MIMSARTRTIIQWTSAAVIIGSIMLAIRALPLNDLMEGLRTWIEGLGVWGPIVFALIYIVATVCFVPGAILTLAIGATFGLLVGFITVSIGSVIGAALAFLISRYVARGTIQRMADSSPKFGAIDEAISEGGWKIVGLLRLSPAIPFNLQNYLYGLTKIVFWKYVLVSWIAMAPGTFLYVYIGHIAGMAAGGESGGTGKWILLIVGLLATVLVTVYITRLAKGKLKETSVKDPDKDIESKQQKRDDSKTGSATRPLVWAFVAVVFLAGAIAAQFQSEAIASLLGGVGGGPPAVEMQETWEVKRGGPTFDHGLFDQVLEQHVDEDGWVDYAGLKQDSSKLDQYIASLNEAPLETPGRNEKLALLINAYNAFTLKLIVENYPLESIKDIRARDRWEAERWKVGGQTWSLNQIEHEQIRPNFKEPRIHFALVCAAVGCPPLAKTAYRGETIETQLAAQTDYVHSHKTWLRVDGGNKTIHLTKLYQWYDGDFEQSAGTVVEFVASVSDEAAQLTADDSKPRVRYLDYDWALNDAKNRQPR